MASCNSKRLDHVASEVGKGTSLRSFCRCRKNPFRYRPNEGKEEASAKRGHECILLVEDEPSVRSLARTVLEEEGYEVCEAPSGIAALEVWRQNQNRIDLLLTDMIMPGGMTGRDLASKLSSSKPELKVIYTSGYSSSLFEDEGFFNQKNFLPKPYTPVRLTAIVRKCLDGNPA